MSDADAYAHSHASLPIEKPKPPAKMGRPRLYEDEVAFTILDRLGRGQALADICEDEDMPSAATFYRWIATLPDLRAAYHCALLAKFDKKSQELVEIADDSSEDNEIVDGADGMPTIRPNKESLGRSELRIKTRQWIMAKELPRKYGEMAALPAPVETVPAQEQKVIDTQPAQAEEDPLIVAIEAWRIPQPELAR